MAASRNEHLKPLGHPPSLAHLPPNCLPCRNPLPHHQHRRYLPRAMHVPTFYAANGNSSNMDLYFTYFVLPIIVVVFGRLHYFGWGFTFPTSAEQTLWRVTSLLITVIPLVTGIMRSLNQWGRSVQREEGRPEQSIEDIALPCIGTPFCVCPCEG